MAGRLGFCAARVRSHRAFVYLTGLHASQFDQLVDVLRPLWERRVVSVKRKEGRPWGIGGLADHLLTLLVTCRTHVTQAFLGCLYGVDRSAICRALARIEPIARRVIGVPKTPRLAAGEAEAILIDCTEQPVERPKRKQRCWYSGKKKRHTVKVEVIATGGGRIAALSDSHPGRNHDMEVRRRGPPLPKGARAYVDSGYQGLQNAHRDTEFPYRKPHGGRLTQDERDYNHALGSIRVGVEHSIGDIKTFRIASDRFRYPRRSHNTKLRIVAGLVNFRNGHFRNTAPNAASGMKKAA